LRHARAYINIYYIGLYDNRCSDRAQTSVKGKFQLSGKIYVVHVKYILYTYVLYWSWLGEEASRNYSNCVLYASDVGGGIPDVCWKSKVKRTRHTLYIYTYTLNYVYIRQRYTHVQEYLSTRVPVMVDSPSV